MASASEILSAYGSQLRRLLPRRVPAGHEYQLLGPLLRVTGQRQGVHRAGQRPRCEAGCSTTGQLQNSGRHPLQNDAWPMPGGLVRRHRYYVPGDGVGRAPQFL